MGNIVRKRIIASDSNNSGGGGSVAPSLREAMVNADKTFSSGILEVYTTVVLTTPRTLTLPLASAFPAGTEITFVDEIGGISRTNYVTITRAGSDTLNGGTTATVKTTYGKCVLISDGISKWTASADTSYIEGTWVPTQTGYSVNPTGTWEYTLNGNICTAIIYETGNGTSNSTSTSITLPFTSLRRIYCYGNAVDNGLGATSFCSGFVTEGTNVMVLGKNSQTAASWTASGGKRIIMVVVYSIA